MTIHNLGSKTTVLGLLRNDVVTATGTGSAIDLLSHRRRYSFSLSERIGASIPFHRTTDLVQRDDDTTK